MHSPDSRQPLAHLRAASLPSAVAHDVDDAVDDLHRLLPLLDRQAGGFRGRANLDAFAAAGAGVRHGVGARFQRGLECSGLGWRRSYLALA